MKNYKEILDYVARQCSVNLSEDKQRETIQQLINVVAMNMWLSTDLKGSLYTFIFQTPSKRWLSLPEYVSEVRALRDIIGAVKIYAQPMRFTAGILQSDNLRRFTDHGYSPLKFTEDIDVSRLTVSMDGAMNKDVTVHITGSGLTFNERTLEFTIAAGTNSLTITTQFTRVLSIRKDVVTDNNVVITDSNNVEIATLDNNRFSTRYKLLQLGQPPVGICDADNLTPQSNLFSYECLYKLRFDGFTGQDQETFPCEEFHTTIAQETIAFKSLMDQRSELEGAKILQASSEETKKRINEEVTRGETYYQQFYDGNPWGADMVRGPQRNPLIHSLPYGGLNTSNGI
jgi:hypothetical protein